MINKVLFIFLPVTLGVRSLIVIGDQFKFNLLKKNF